MDTIRNIERNKIKIEGRNKKVKRFVIVLKVSTEIIVKPG